MKLINPRGEKVEMEDNQAKKILAHPGKLKQGWKKFIQPKKKRTPKKK